MWIEVEVPDTLSALLGGDPERLKARTLEALVISLWQMGEISTRVAAEALGLTYRDYLALLATKGVPVALPPNQDYAEVLGGE